MQSFMNENKTLAGRAGPQDH